MSVINLYHFLFDRLAQLLYPYLLLLNTYSPETGYQSDTVIPLNAMLPSPSAQAPFRARSSS